VPFLIAKYADAQVDLVGARVGGMLADDPQQGIVGLAGQGRETHGKASWTERRAP